MQGGEFCPSAGTLLRDVTTGRIRKDGKKGQFYPFWLCARGFTQEAGIVKRTVSLLVQEKQQERLEAASEHDELNVAFHNAPSIFQPF